MKVIGLKGGDDVLAFTQQLLGKTPAQRWPVQMKHLAEEFEETWDSAAEVDSRFVKTDTGFIFENSPVPFIISLGALAAFGAKLVIHLNGGVIDGMDKSHVDEVFNNFRSSIAAGVGIATLINVLTGE